MTSKAIIQVLHEACTLLQVNIDSNTLKWVDMRNKQYDLSNVNEFLQDLREAGSKNSIVILQKDVQPDVFELFLKNFDAPVLVFLKEKDSIVPTLIKTGHKPKDRSVICIASDRIYSMDFDKLETAEFVTNAQSEIIVASLFAYESVAGSRNEETDEDVQFTPVRRLFKLLKTERKDILYIYIYAIIIGVSSLILPLGIQAAIELISGGVFFSSIYFLIGFVILGVVGSGILQVFQITIVEYLQRRVFTKAAFEFAYRVPRIKMEAIMNIHFPELINRFFDVLTIQKGLPKLLIDLSTAGIQILFGLVLLSLYHPFFILFGISLVFSLFLIFYLTGPKALASSIVESKYKYKAVYWLEELARALYSFKISGSTILPIRKTDYLVNNYLKYRQKHFETLVTQYAYILLFKAVITAGLLILGTILVVQREITLGQFVASEVIIILILNSVEKIISYIDVIYDMLTALDKIAQVTDLPLEKSGGLDVPRFDKRFEKGLEIHFKNMSYRYPNNQKPTLDNINLHIKSGERICISGLGSSGKTTLTSTISGIYSDFSGTITVNGISLRDLDHTHLRDLIGKNISTEDVFDGTILENIMVGKPNMDVSNAIMAIEASGLHSVLDTMPEGLNTQVVSGGKGFSESFIRRMILARCLAKRPQLLILNNFFTNFSKIDRKELAQKLVARENTWTLIVVSNEVDIMAACDRVIYLKEGTILAEGTFDQIIQNKFILENI